MIESYADGGLLLERWDVSGYTRWDAAGVVVESRPLTDDEARDVAAVAASLAAPVSPPVDVRLAQIEADVDALIVAVLS